MLIQVLALLTRTVMLLWAGGLTLPRVKIYGRLRLICGRLPYRHLHLQRRGTRLGTLWGQTVTAFARGATVRLASTRTLGI